MSDELMRWIEAEILPHEPAVRRWVRGSPLTAGEEDDILQEAYFRLSKVPDVRAVRSARTYFFTVARNIILERLRRRRVVPIHSMAEVDTLGIVADIPRADDLLIARQQLQILLALIDELPPRCRAVIRSRRIDNLSQRETARRLMISENVVEKEVAAGMRFIAARFHRSADDLPTAKRMGQDANRRERR